MHTVEQISEKMQSSFEAYILAHLEVNPNYTRKEVIELVRQEVEQQLKKNGGVLAHFTIEDFDPIIVKIVKQVVAP